jgi:hypothetical protein
MVRRGCETFLVPVATLDALPPGFAEALTAVHPLELVRGMLLIPPQPFLTSRLDRLRRPWYATRYTPRRLLAFSDEQITFVEEAGEGADEPVVIPVDSLLAIDLTIILLYATLELTWASGTQARSLKLRFNAVGERYMQTELNRVREMRTLVRGRHPPLSREAARDKAASLPLKFRNYLWLTPLPDDSVVEMVFHPAVHDHGPFHRQLSQGRLVVVTTRELIVLEDIRNAEYGIIRRTYPLSALAQVCYAALPDGTGLGLTFRAGMAAHSITLPLSAEKMRRLEHAVALAPV